ncbi:MAG: 2-oxoglutarate dehydrogenase E1 component [Gemmatimonadota bacterium]|nr:2-oxoglutarate dehydrogenase E1 component [Gemmatimonadota bacterium]
MKAFAQTSIFNDGYIAEQFEQYRRDPGSVDESWRQYFRVAESLFAAGSNGSQPASSVVDASTAVDSKAAPSDGSHVSVSTDAALLQKAAAASALQAAIRNYGHFAVQIDPLGSPPPGAAELTPEFHGITEADLQGLPGGLLDARYTTAAEVIERKREVYSRHIGFEVWHLSEEAEREWFRKTFRDHSVTRDLTVDEKKAVLHRLNEVDGLERFLGRAYVGLRRFSIEGTDMLVPMLDETINECGRVGAREIVIGMAHRGRLNVLTNVMGKPYEALFAEFEGYHDHADENATGDVKYHLGYEGTRMVGDHEVQLHLVPNPSHLEMVNPVVEGVTRARQRVPGKPAMRDETLVVPVAIHGDAAFPGEGVVAETLNISRLAGYRTGGTIHIIVNNQVGFTTEPTDARSTHYSSDLAKGFEIPIFHVNGDDAQSCIQAVRLACAYRTEFKKDVLIDLVGYRRHGHNETDEPSFTQPVLYAKIKAHPTVPQAWAARLVADGVLTAEEAAADEKAVFDAYTQMHTHFKASLASSEKHAPWPQEPSSTPRSVAQAVSVEQLREINEALLTYPADFSPHPRLAKTLERRREAMGDAGGIDWGHAEALAFGSLLQNGVSIRLSGQDAERGTFSHRHAVLSDIETGKRYTPLAHLQNATGAIEIYNSALSETAILGFEYGFSTVADDALVLWEAQFGDFVNVAQPIIDQFIVSDRAKWGSDSSVVLLLPHGHEGAGPEHSSARPERFLQLCAERNIVVAYCSTPAQYFHLLRRQALRRPRRPLVCLQPKSLLRLPQAASKLNELASEQFQPVIDDPSMLDKKSDVRRLVFCTGKLYYDLSMAPNRSPNVALVRVEELYPWPHEEVARITESYPSLEQVVWAQEEPRNQGAWTYAQPRLRASAGAALGVTYVGRSERASTAEGYKDAHDAEQARIVADVMHVAESFPAFTGRSGHS